MPFCKPLAHYAAEGGRDEAIWRAYTSGGYSLKQIGDHFGLHYSHVSRIVRAQREAGGVAVVEAQ